MVILMVYLSQLKQRFSNDAILIVPCWRVNRRGLQGGIKLVSGLTAQILSPG